MSTKTTTDTPARNGHGFPLLKSAGQDGRTATVHAEVDTSAADVFATLADARTYGDWVVGAKEIRRWDTTWPATGSTFHHTQGTVLFNIKDTTSVIENVPDRRLALEVRARPLLVARTEFILEPVSRNRTRITMHETPTAGLLHAIDNPGLTALVALRNKETLRRLRNVVRQRSEHRRGA